MAAAEPLVAGTPTPSAYLQIACTAWYVYDWILTLNDEVEYIWQRRWSFSKGLFLLIRVTTVSVLAAETAQYVFLENLSEAQYVRSDASSLAHTRLNRCNIFSWALAIATAVIVFEIDIVLQIRVWILYQKSLQILLWNGVLFVLNVLCAVVLFLELYSKEQFVEVPPWIQGACYDVRPKALGTIWAAPLCFEINLTVLMVYKVTRDHRLHGRLDGPSLASTLVRDSVLYFVLLVAVVGLNLFFWAETDLKVTLGDSAVK
ncbi:hypothetical protein EXIGLDRAFT_764136 [Exidia glandulosa HHB12029]|uniref:DUF6533 domain-containing protein n=1 Tax=Exidia glandulosa HHB12029 TaxID=1314781 RepID=A0A165LFT1_EXIGL|nr:hypothetical protein EXIGLDRAFT_764136 [Exidia glandulosa HHB12029]